MFSSSQIKGNTPKQLPPLQVSKSVQALPSLHGSVLKGCVHAPPPQTSFVQELPSSAHGRTLLVKTQPVAGLHESSVHGLPSLQTTGVPEHAPPLQASADVHALPSSHAFALLTCKQDPFGWQSPVVQGLVSSWSHCASFWHCPQHKLPVPPGHPPTPILQIGVLPEQPAFVVHGSGSTQKPLVQMLHAAVGEKTLAGDGQGNGQSEFWLHDIGAQHPLLHCLSIGQSLLV